LNSRVRRITNKIIVGETTKINALVVVGAMEARGVKYLIISEIVNEINSTSIMIIKLLTLLPLKGFI
jgi:hypothetical protein